jgi:hypothetical protein
MSLDLQQLLHKARAEWLVMAFGLMANVILIAYLGWRMSVINDVVARKEIEFHSIWMVQEELRNNQREMLSRQTEMLRILEPYDHAAQRKAQLKKPSP